MREAIGEAVVRWWAHHRDLVADMFEHLEHTAAVAVGGVQFEVEQGELQLARHHHAGLEVLRRQHHVQLVLRQGFAGLVVAGNVRQAFGVPAPVLHELARQLHRIPGHAVDARRASVLDLGQEVVQAMAEFVEQRGDLVMGQERRALAHRRGEVADQVGHRRLQRAVSGAALVAGAVHPGAATLVRSRVEVEEEAPDVLAVLADFEQTHVRMPAIEAFQLVDLDAVQALDDAEQPGQHLVDGEIGAQFFLVQAVALLAQLLGVVAEVPALQVVQTLLGGEGAQFGQVALGERLAAHRQVTQEIQHLLGGFGHLGCQRQLGEVAVAEQPSQLMAQFEDLGHYRTVVELPGVRALVRGAGAVGGVDLLAQGTVVGVGHHRVVAGEFQGDQPAVEALGLRRLGHLRLGRIGDAGQQAFVGDVPGPGLSGVQQLVGKFAAELGKLHLDGAEALLLHRWKVDAGQAEVAQRMLEDGLLRHLETGRRGARGQRLVGLEQRAVLPEFGVVGRQLGQAGLVGRAQFRAVAHGVEVADWAPGAGEALVQLVQPDHQGLPVQALGRAAEQLLDRHAVVAEDGVDGRLDVLRANLGVGWQVEFLQQGIVRAHGDTL